MTRTAISDTLLSEIAYAVGVGIIVANHQNRIVYINPVAPQIGRLE